MPKSKTVISVCKELDTNLLYVPCLNASISDIDWIINLLQKEKHKLENIMNTGEIPVYRLNKHIE